MTLDEIKYGLKLLYQEKILEVGAIDTGALYESVDPEIRFDEDGPKVDVWAESYLIYVDDGTIYITAREITYKWENDPRFDFLMEELTGLWTEWYLENNLYGLRDSSGKFRSVRVI
jgi:hypothetical protein